VIVKPAQVIDLAFEISVTVNAGTQISVTSSIASALQSEFAASNQDLGKSYLIGSLIRNITQINGVLNVNYIKVFNKVGGVYSSSSLDSSLIIDTTTNEIDLTSGAIKVGAEQVLQLKYPNTDIKVIPVTISTTGF
jgi:hypothetical protein